MISINYQDSRPIYEQIVSGYQKLIFRGVLQPDQRIPSVRSTAAGWSGRDLFIRSAAGGILCAETPA